MSEETRKAVAAKYRDGYFQNDAVAKAWADEFFPLDSKPAKEDKKAKKSKK